MTNAFDAIILKVTQKTGSRTFWQKMVRIITFAIALTICSSLVTGMFYSVGYHWIASLAAIARNAQSPTRKMEPWFPSFVAAIFAGLSLMLFRSLQGSGDTTVAAGAAGLGLVLGIARGIKIMRRYLEISK